MKISDVTFLGQGDRALILNIDEKDFLFISGKNSGALLTEIKSINQFRGPAVNDGNTNKNQNKAFEIKSLIEKRIQNDKDS